MFKKPSRPEILKFILFRYPSWPFPLAHGRYKQVWLAWLKVGLSSATSLACRTEFSIDWPTKPLIGCFSPFDRLGQPF